MKDYFHPIADYTPEEAKQAQLSRFYHDARGGYPVCAVRQGESWREYPVRDWQSYAYPLESREADVYVSLASFVKGEKSTQNILNRSVLLADLDCHTEAEEEREEKLQAAMAALNRAFEDGMLPVPAVITHTGRGLALFYILLRSIPYRLENGTAVAQEKSARSEKRCRYVYEGLLNRIDEVVKEAGIRTDRQVTDASRVVRLAGTWNTKADKACKLLYAGEETDCYTSLEELAAYLPDQGYPERPSVRTAIPKNRVCYMLRNRVELLSGLVALRGGHCTGYRSCLCLVAYNAFYRLYGEEEGKEQLLRFNDRFTEPLSLSELNSIVRETVRHPYRFRDKTLRTRLHITDTEAAALGWGERKDKREQREKSRQNRINREARRYEIACYLLEHPAMPYRAVAEEFQCSERTVRLISEAYGVQKKDKGVTREMLQAVYEEKLAGIEEESKAVKKQLLYNVVRNKEEICQTETGSACHTVWTAPKELPVLKDYGIEVSGRTAYQYLSLASFAEMVTVFTDELYQEKDTVKEILDCLAEKGEEENLFAYWNSLATDEQWGQVRHLMKQVSKYGERRLKKFLTYAYEACCTPDMTYNLEQVCDYFQVSDVSEIKIEKRVMTKKQKETCLKNRLRWMGPRLVDVRKVNYSLFY